MIAKAIIVGTVVSQNIKVMKNGHQYITLSVETDEKADKSSKGAFARSRHFVYCYDKSAQEAIYAKVGSIVTIEGTIRNQRIDEEPFFGKYLYNILCNYIKVIDCTAQNCEGNYDDI